MHTSPSPYLAAFAAMIAWVGCSADADRSGLGSRNRPSTGSGASGMGPAGGGSGSGSAGLDIGTGPGVVMPVGGSMAPVMQTDGGECGGVQQTAENTLQPADIIIGIDTSGSMDDEIVFVQENLNAFSQQIIDSGVDVRVILIATEGVTMPEMNPGGIFGGGDDEEIAVCIGPPLGSGMCPGDSNPPVYTHVNQEIRSHDILNVFVATYPTWKPQLRENSLKTFVAITDDDATQGPYNTADLFIDGIRTLDPNPMMWANWKFSGIYCFTDCAPYAANIGTVPADLVMKTGGVAGDLCLQDFKPVFDELAKQVVDSVTLSCDWVIPPPPGTETFDKAKTNVVLNLDGASETLGKAAGADGCGDQNGWHYDDEAVPTKVVACPATCTRIQAAQNATVDILFGCETIKIIPD